MKVEKKTRGRDRLALSIHHQSEQQASVGHLYLNTVKGSICLPILLVKKRKIYRKSSSCCLETSFETCSIL